MLLRNFWLRRTYQQLPTNTTPTRRHRSLLAQIGTIPTLIIMFLIGITIGSLLIVVLKPVSYKPLDDYQILNVLPVVQGHPSSSLAPSNNDRAVVSALYSDSFAIATAVLGHSIRSVNCTARLVLMYIEDKVSNEALCINRAAGWETIPVTRIAPPSNKDNFHHYTDVFTKLHLWALDRRGINSVVYLDADTLVLRNFDELFDLPFNFAAVPDVWGPKDPRGFEHSFNSGVLALKTSSAAFENMKSTIGVAQYPTDRAEQSFLNLYFAAKAARLPYIYNANMAIKRRSPAVWKEMKQEMSILHYTLVKPFLTEYDPPESLMLTAQETEEAVDDAKSRASEFAEEFEWWRLAFRRMIEDKGTVVDTCRH